MSHPLLQADLRMRWIIVCTLIGLILPQWLVTTDMFDGANIWFARFIQNPEGIFLWLSNANWWLAVLHYKLWFFLSDVTGVSYLVFVKLAMSAMLVCLYVECVFFGREVLRLNSPQAQLAGLLCVASPCLYILVNSASNLNLFCLWFVLLGHRLYWSGSAKIRTIGLFVLVVSFQINSNLVFALALEFVRWIDNPQQRKQRMLWFLVLVVTAITVYVSMRLLSPPQQIFVEYNKLLNPFDLQSLRRIFRASAMFLTWGIIPLFAFLALAVTGPLYRRIAPPSCKSHDYEAITWSRYAVLLFLSAAAAFPYIMVGKGPPLFTPTQYGDGLTEQVLRSVHSWYFAPTWANTSMRHGLLLSIPIAFLTWFVAQDTLKRLRVTMQPHMVFFILLVLSLLWVLPSQHNKLQQQYVQNSLVKAFRALPPAPAGIVELRYSPSSDWLIWTNSANVILQKAWGKTHHLGMFHAIDVYRDDLYWQYHAYMKSNDVINTPIFQNMVSLQGFPGEDCITKYVGTWPKPNILDAWLGGVFNERVAAATITMTESSCVPGRQLANPTPWKIVIP